jgi:UDP-glucose 4-epimerase
VHALVTGGAGFIGAALVERLLAEGHTVDVVDNLATGSLWNLADARASAGRDLSFHQLDVRSPDVAELIVRRHPEVVWHLAATAPSASPAQDAQVNIVGTLSVLEGVRAAGTRKLIVTSSASVYGDLDGRDPATEQDARQPLTLEGVTKHTIDAYLAAYAELEAIVFTSVILSTVYGPRAVSGVVAAWAECLASGRACTVFGDGRQVRDFVYVDDVVDALARAADRADGMFVNVATGVGTSLVDLHGALLGAGGGDTSLREGPARPGEPYKVVLDPSRAAAVLDWKPWTTLAEGLETVRRSVPRPS